jgi:hypothetical protein
MNHTLGRSIMTTALLQFAEALSEHNHGLSDEWKAIIENQFTLESADKVLDGLIPEHHGYSRLLNNFAVKTKVCLVCNSHDDSIFVDPDRIAVNVLSLFLGLKSVPVKIVDVNSQMFNKDMSSAKPGEHVFITGKVWTSAILHEVAAIVKERGQSSTTTSRIFVVLPSKQLLDAFPPDRKVLDWTATSGVLSCRLFDILMEHKSPHFHTEATNLST